MRTQFIVALLLFGCGVLVTNAHTQSRVGALAIDGGQGNRYGWAINYESVQDARQEALSQCGSGCSVVLTFERCAAYAADQASASTVYGWAESFDSSQRAREGALGWCRSRGGLQCIVRAWGCNGS